MRGKLVYVTDATTNTVISQIVVKNPPKRVMTLIEKYIQIKSQVEELTEQLKVIEARLRKVIKKAPPEIVEWNGWEIGYKPEVRVSFRGQDAVLRAWRIAAEKEILPQVARINARAVRAVAQKEDDRALAETTKIIVASKFVTIHK